MTPVVIWSARVWEVRECGECGECGECVLVCMYYAHSIKYIIKIINTNQYSYTAIGYAIGHAIGYAIGYKALKRVNCQAEA